MIKANELRIGNWVEVDDKPALVTQIFDSGITCNHNDDITNGEAFKHITPIPLTPEILEKAGFENGCPYSKEYGHTAPKEAFFFENDYYPNEMSNGRSIGTEIKYMHQLQNLYFALTGEELPLIL